MTREELARISTADDVRHPVRDRMRSKLHQDVVLLCASLRWREQLVFSRGTTLLTAVCCKIFTVDLTAPFIVTVREGEILGRDATSTVDIVDGHEGKDYWTVDLPMAFLMHTFTTYRCVRNVVADERKTLQRRIEGGICFRLRESVDLSPVHAGSEPDT